VGWPDVLSRLGGVVELHAAFRESRTRGSV
jgi:hypothetical protein